MVTKAECRRKLVVDQSARLTAVYMLAGAGVHESTSDLVFSGHAMIAAKGRLLAENQRFEREGATVTADVKIAWLDNQRRSWTSHNEVPTTPVRGRWCPCQKRRTRLLRLGQASLVPQDAAPWPHAARRFSPYRQVRQPSACSTAAPNVWSSACQAGWIRPWLCWRRPGAAIARTAAHDHHGVTMPGMGTTGRTQSNAVAVAGELGGIRIIDIKDTVTAFPRYRT